MAAVYVSGVLAGGPGGGCHAYDVDGDDDDDDVERNKCNICNQGSLWTSILKPGVFLSGASGGLYALITGEIFMFVMIKTFLEIFLNNLFQFDIHQFFSLFRTLGNANNEPPRDELSLASFSTFFTITIAIKISKFNVDDSHFILACQN